MVNVEIILFTAFVANVLKNRFSIGINCVGLSKEMKNEHAAYPNISINVRQIEDFTGICKSACVLHTGAGCSKAS